MNAMAILPTVCISNPFVDLTFLRSLNSCFFIQPVEK